MEEPLESPEQPLLLPVGAKNLRQVMGLDDGCSHSLREDQLPELPASAICRIAS